MFSVLVEAIGIAGGAANWVTIGKIENPMSLDIDFLRQKAMEIVNSRCPRPFANALRLSVIRDGIREMKVTLTDLW